MCLYLLKCEMHDDDASSFQGLQDLVRHNIIHSGFIMEEAEAACPYIKTLR